MIIKLLQIKGMKFKNYEQLYTNILDNRDEMTNSRNTNYQNLLVKEKLKRPMVRDLINNKKCLNKKP